MVQNAGVDRGNVEIVLSDSESIINEDNLTNESRNKKTLNDVLLKKLTNNIVHRSNLSSVHTARAHKYGHVHFYPKSWDKESSNISTKLTSQEDRIKLCQGLKCNVDFLNQLNMDDLMANFINGDQDITLLLKTTISKLVDTFECLKHIPMLDILKLICNKKAKKIFVPIDKIFAFAHVSQSMDNYFAQDDNPRSALSTVCQALRRNIDVEYILRSWWGGDVPGFGVCVLPSEVHK